MANLRLRDSIAAEAARLILRGQETEYPTARKRAARWLSRKKIVYDDMPTNVEIENKIYAISGLFADGYIPRNYHQHDSVAEHIYHPDTFSALRMLLKRLDKVPLDPSKHPEGNALYHSLQVFELGLAAQPYDEEFLLACLLHDVGLGVDRKNSVHAAIETLKGMVTDRTLFLIENRSAAFEFLQTGKISRSLRRSEHFEELTLLARCDRDGRVPGAKVGTLDEALEYIAGLSAAWDDA